MRLVKKSYARKMCKEVVVAWIEAMFQNISWDTEILRETPVKLTYLGTDNWNVQFINNKHSKTHLIVQYGPSFKVTMFHLLEAEIGKEGIATLKVQKWMFRDPLNKTDYKTSKILKRFGRWSL